MTYSDAFLKAVDKLMDYEVGGWWDVNAPGAQDGTIPHACGYVNDPNDPGGETKYGISKNENPSVDVTNLTWIQAQGIYYNRYWLAGKCDQLPPQVAILQFDACVNNGVGGATKFLQTALGVTVDGVIGPQTIAAANACDVNTLCTGMCTARKTFYDNLVIARPSDQEYLDGWLRRVTDMYSFSTSLDNNF